MCLVYNCTDTFNLEHFEQFRVRAYLLLVLVVKENGPKTQCKFALIECLVAVGR